MVGFGSSSKASAAGAAKLTSCCPSGRVESPARRDRRDPRACEDLWAPQDHRAPEAFKG